MNADERRFDPLIERILQAVFEVSNILGCGFLEKVYERALLKNWRSKESEPRPRFCIPSNIRALV